MYDEKHRSLLRSLNLAWILLRSGCMATKAKESMTTDFAENIGIEISGCI
jgi:hypothetical protein